MKNLTTGILPAICVAMAAGAADASSITLNGTIRDFNSSHPDFQGTIAGLETGAVESTLVGGKPVLSASGAASNQFSNAANFAQWYTDVPGVNMTKSHAITLNETAPGSGIYEYSNSSFFPIDGELFGNQGRPHNYHFTYELAGMTSFKAADVFEFKGDDDLWVFVNGQLVLDLGGVHPVAGGSFTGVDLMNKGLLENTSYSYNIFFAERHTTHSNFKISTSLVFNSAPAPIPLPAGLPLLLAGLGGFGLIRMRKQA